MKNRSQHRQEETNFMKWKIECGRRMWLGCLNDECKYMRKKETARTYKPLMDDEHDRCHEGMPVMWWLHEG